MSLCLDCGLCCTGVFFSKAELRRDEVEHADRIGLSIISRKRAPHYELPCPRLEGNACTVYAERPSCCRTYTCRLLDDHQAGIVSRERAVAVIERVRELAAAIRGGIAGVPPEEALLDSILSLDSARGAVEWRRGRVALLLDVGEYVILARRHFGVRDRRPPRPTNGVPSGAAVPYLDHQLVKSAADVASRILDGDAVILDLKTGTYFGLNEVGSRFWELMGDGGSRLGEIRTRLLEEFAVDEATLRGDLDELVATLEARGLVEITR